MIKDLLRNEIVKSMAYIADHKSRKYEIRAALTSAYNCIDGLLDPDDLQSITVQSSDIEQIYTGYYSEVIVSPTQSMDLNSIVMYGGLALDVANSETSYSYYVGAPAYTITEDDVTPIPVIDVYGGITAGDWTIIGLFRGTGYTDRYFGLGVSDNLLYPITIRNLLTSPVITIGGTNIRDCHNESTYFTLLGYAFVDSNESLSLFNIPSNQVTSLTASSLQLKTLNMSTGSNTIVRDKPLNHLTYVAGLSSTSGLHSGDNSIKTLSVSIRNYLT
jgi:hypothetical protein